MKKLKLNVEELEVRSFETAAASEERGTVHGNGASDVWYCFGTMVCSVLCPPSPDEVEA